MKRRAHLLALGMWTSATLCAGRASADLPSESSSERGGASAPGTNAAENGQEGAYELAAPRVVASIIGPNPSYVGQMVQVQVELLRDNRQEQKVAPFFSELQMDGAITVVSTSSPPADLKNLDGVTFLSQKRRYLVFPQAEGDLTVPAVFVAIQTPEGAPFSVSSTPLSLRADIPRGAGARLPLVARRVKVERTIEGDLQHLQVGDAFTVSLRISADDTDPVMLPAFELPEIRGLARYLGQASSSARSDRGSYHAERVDTATYVANEWGLYRLPRQSVFWLDPTTGEYGEAVAEVQSFRVRVNPKLGAGCAGGPEAAVTLGGGIGLLFVGVLLGVRLGRRFARERARRARVRPSADERAAFLALRTAAKTGKDGATLTALYAWLAFALEDVPTLSGLRRFADDEGLSNRIAELETRVSTGKGPGRAQDIIAPLAKLRKSSSVPSGARTRLPALNERH